MLERTLDYSNERKIGHIVRDMNEHTIKKYLPEQAIIEVVNNLWFPSFERDTLLLMTIEEAEELAYQTFQSLCPHLDRNLAQSFVDDTIFHLAFKLSHQGKERDFVDGFDEKRGKTIETPFPETEE